jgi:hypothetical protein
VIGVASVIALANGNHGNLLRSGDEGIIHVITTIVKRRMLLA